MSFANAIATLRKLRSTGECNALKTVQCAQLALAHPSRLANEVWTVKEQYILALADLCKLDEANTYLDSLSEKFPKSRRVAKIRAALLEATGDYAKADEIYSAILREDGTHTPAFKRKIALLKSQGKSKDAIAALNAYLDTFSNDIEGWLELTDLYLKEDKFQQAAFSMEEVLLLQPFNHLFHCKYAEILYTISGVINIKKALEYFCRSIELVTDYVRGLYGVQKCITALLQLVNESNENDDDNNNNNKELQEELNQNYLNELKQLYTIINSRLIHLYENLNNTVVNNQDDDSLTLQVIRQWTLSIK